MEIEDKDSKDVRWSLVKKRHERNLGTISEEDMELLAKSRVGVVGAGGLGGYVIEMLARIGVGTIKVMDGDVFDETNLNRQLLSQMDNLGTSKVITAKQRIHNIDQQVHIMTYQSRFDLSSGLEFIKGIDLLVDCVDNVETRLLMEELAGQEGIPLVHGAVGGWVGQVMTVLPGDFMLKEIYSETRLPKSSAASFIPATVASYQVAECIKLITGKGQVLRGKLMYFDLLTNENFIVEIMKAEDN